MKSSRNLAWSELKLGVIIIVSLLLFAVGILRLGGGAGLFSGTYTLYMQLENTFGLKEGSTVRLAGIQVGNVEEITFSDDPANPEVVVRMDILDKYQDRIREDSDVSIKSLGLLGDKYVDISVGSPRSRVLQDGDAFKETPKPEMANVLAKAGTGIDSLNAVIDQLRIIMGEVVEGDGTLGMLLRDPDLYRDIDRAVKEIEAIAANLHDSRGSFGKLVNEPDLYDNLLDVSAKARLVAENLNSGSLAKLSEDDEFYKNLREISDNLNLVSQSAKDLVANLQTGSLAKISKDEKLYKDIKGISGKLDAVIAKLENGEGSAGKLLTDAELYDNMNSFFKDADELVKDIKENPDRYVSISIF